MHRHEHLEELRIELLIQLLLRRQRPELSRQLEQNLTQRAHLTDR